MNVDVFTLNLNILSKLEEVLRSLRSKEDFIYAMDVSKEKSRPYGCQNFEYLPRFNIFSCDVTLFRVFLKIFLMVSVFSPPQSSSSFLIGATARDGSWYRRFYESTRPGLERVFHLSYKFRPLTCLAVVFLPSFNPFSY